MFVVLSIYSYLVLQNVAEQVSPCYVFCYSGYKESRRHFLVKVIKWRKLPPFVNFPVVEKCISIPALPVAATML